MTFTPTPEQQAIVDAARNTSDNLLISALAGAAKTSTLVLIAQALPQTSMLCLAFNKRIAEEMKERLPSNCQAKTLNGVGHKAWMDFTGRRNLQVESKKNYDLLKAIVEDLPPAEKYDVYTVFADILQMIREGKSAGWVPSGTHHMAKSLLTDEEFFAGLDEEPPALVRDLVIEVSRRSFKKCFEGLIDFDDQVLTAGVMPVSFPQFPLVLIDETQDLSELNHVMLGKLAKKRLIAVGDENQAIYGFRGAHESSMHELQQKFSMRELSLTVSFRCPIKVVEEAQWRAPAMKWPEWAKEGEVRRLKDWHAGTLEEGAAIICRNNAPLFNTAINLLRNGRYPELVGNDIGGRLLKIMAKFGDESMPQEEVFAAIAAWAEEKKAKSRTPEKIDDQAECLKIFAEQGKTLGEAILYAKRIFDATGPIKLMTGHKSKGLEYDFVYFLDEHLVGDRGQERNLRYVIITRAKQTLTYITTEGFLFNDEVPNV